MRIRDYKVRFSARINTSNVDMQHKLFYSKLEKSNKFYGIDGFYYGKEERKSEKLDAFISFYNEDIICVYCLRVFLYITRRK